MPTKPLIALISATPASMRPAAEGMSTGFPGATVWNLLDDRLLKDASGAGGLTPALQARMQRLIDHAAMEGAAAVLLTCSMYGPVAHAATTSTLPVLAADDAAFAAAADGGYNRILVVASFGAALADAVDRLTVFLRENASAANVLGVVAPEAFAAALSNDTAALLAAVLDAVHPFAGSYDAILLAQYSLAPVVQQLAELVDAPVLAGPSIAAHTLKSLVGVADVPTAPHL